jgi:alpha-ketoglutarate-dependent taurine dioxygenase
MQPDFKARQRKVVRVSEDALVRVGFVDDAAQLPVLIEPAAPGVDLLGWAAGHRDQLDARLLAHGAILLRGFDVAGPEQFQRFAGEVCGDLLDYTERAAPRLEVSKGVYTSTEFPADQWIPLHHEMSYAHHWPRKILFYCDVAPLARGCTPIVRASTFMARLDARIRQKFLEKKVMYVRNYGEGVDLSWQDTFQTTDRAVVEEYCRQAGMTTEWRDGDRLRTRAVRHAVIDHPQTGEAIWFNHAHMFHSSNLPAEVGDVLRAQFAEDELPRNAFYGDGSPIESSILEQIRQLYLDASLLFPWRRGDILILDNFLVAHGREPFAGPRRILVSLSGLLRPADAAS